MAGDGTGEGGSANPAEGGGVGTTTLFTQEQVNSIAAREKRSHLSAYFKELGFDAPPTAEELKGTLDAAAEHRKQQEGQKGDVERLTGELAAEKEKSAKVPGLELARLQAEIAAEAGLKPRYWKYIEGKTEDEIKESVKGILADVGGGAEDGEGDGEDGDKDKSKDKSKIGSGNKPKPQDQQGGGGGKPPKPTLSAGREAYEKMHPSKK